MDKQLPNQVTAGQEPVIKRKSPAFPRTGWGWRLWLAAASLLILVEIFVQVLKGLGWETYTAKNSGLQGTQVTALAVDDQNRVWAGTNKGISVVDSNGNWISYAFPELTETGGFVSAIAFRKNQVWVGQRRVYSGLNVLGEDGVWTKYAIMTVAPYHTSEVKDIEVDPSGQVWVGTSHDGLRMLKPGEGWMVYPDLPQKIFDLAVDSRGQVWVVSEEGIGYLDTNKRWNIVDFSYSDPTTVTVGPKDTVWVGTYAGVISRKSISDSNWLNFYPNNIYSITRIAIDYKGQGWASTYSGTLVFIPNTGGWLQYTKQNSGLRNRRITDVVVDQQGRVWAGGSTLSVVDPGLTVSPSLIEGYNNFRGCVAIPALVGLALILTVKGLAARSRKAAAGKVTGKPAVHPAPLAVQASVKMPVAAAKQIPLAAGSNPMPGHTAAQLLEAFREGDATQRLWALRELEKMGEVEEF